MAIKTNTKNYVGKQLVLEAGTTVRQWGFNQVQQRTTAVTVLAQNLDSRSGRVRVFWKRNGIEASALV